MDNDVEKSFSDKIKLTAADKSLLLLYFILSAILLLISSYIYGRLFIMQLRI